jgi:hypothetical protein
MNLEPKHTLFGSVDQLLAPKTLSKLISKHVTHVEIEPMNGHSGLAGGQMNYVNTNVGRMVLKRMSSKSDWIMFASNDHVCRSVTLWQYGLLDQLNPHIEHKIIACSRDGEGWSILNEDLTGYCFAWDKPMGPGLVTTFLDVLARIHSTFWNDPCLNEKRLGLCDIASLIDSTSPLKAQSHDTQDRGVIPHWIKGGWKVMEELLEPDVYRQMRRLIESPQPLVETLSRYPHTLLHGDYRAENLAYLDTPVIIDWQMASRSLMTIDLAWFVREGYVQESLGQVQAVSYYRNQLESYLHHYIDDADWQTMLDLGFLVDSLRVTCISAYWYKQHANANNIKERDYHAWGVKTRGQQVRDALRWINLS